MSWFDWSLLAGHADVLRFVKLLIARRLLRDVEPERQRLSLNQLLLNSNIIWHGVKLGQPDWSDSSHSLALSADSQNGTLLFHIILNAYCEPLDFELPQAGDRGKEPLRRWIDTSLDSPHDIVEWHTAEPVLDGTYRAGPRSVVVLFAPMKGA